MVSEASDHGLLAPWLWIGGKTAHHGGWSRCSSHGSRGEMEERRAEERDKEKNRRVKERKQPHG